MSDLRASTAQGKAQSGLIYNKVCVCGAGEYQGALIFCPVSVVADFCQRLYVLLEGRILMRLSIRNIGVIKDACIELDGITVIPGENLSGKSTALKALSSLISANNRTGDGFLPDEKLVALRSFRERFGDEINCSYIESEGSVSVTCDNGGKIAGGFRPE